MLNIFRQKDKRAQAGSEAPVFQTNPNVDRPRSNLVRRPSLKVKTILQHTVNIGAKRNLTRLLSTSGSVDRSSKPPPKVQKSHSAELEQSIKQIGSLFKREATASEMQGNVIDPNPDDDSAGDIRRIRHVSGVTSHSPTVVTPDRSSAGSFPPHDPGVIPEVVFVHHSDDEESIFSEYSIYSQASSPMDQQSGSSYQAKTSPHDYLKVNIPDGTLEPPTSPREMLHKRSRCP
ncbi:hypothetical protein QCA50_002811 [Cerrena zonata]|uniref:Uncharacterized protein n=1 Tax=Cerrena zonata TaxID=2478898 RepID=A0AAW0GQE0_9APHY